MSWNTGAFCQAALEIADRKMFRDQKTAKLCSFRWTPAIDMVLCGLRCYGLIDPAKKFAERFCTAAAPDFCGWSALIPITIYREFVQN